jgi:hypothetical protein
VASIVRFLSILILQKTKEEEFELWACSVDQLSLLFKRDRQPTTLKRRRSELFSSFLAL